MRIIQERNEICMYECESEREIMELLHDVILKQRKYLAKLNRIKLFECILIFTDTAIKY